MRKVTEMMKLRRDFKRKLEKKRILELQISEYDAIIIRKNKDAGLYGEILNYDSLKSEILFYELLRSRASRKLSITIFEKQILSSQIRQSLKGLLENHTIEEIISSLIDETNQNEPYDLSSFKEEFIEIYLNHTSVK
ncbi:hypothetical protein QFZ81_000994 [Paenibacillus sp. V4I9]|uniref:hypothetical protein n=1 Tax=Paenibacillus sp. V4I9 TaxID=3042308 RepID=UPI00278B9561|nr:hypothetical protein [Paenibacillus sp. V4I9]MDQ0885906.1 hypothetical protein [Paenibacillus sp. V4I9]